MCKVSINYMKKIIRDYNIKIAIINFFITLEDFQRGLTPKDVDNLATFVSEFLQVSIPAIEFISLQNENEGGHTLFSVDEKGQITAEKIVLYNEDLPFTTEEKRIAFLDTIIHEVRHIWQSQNLFNNFMDDGYKSNAEVDARAFSHLFLEYFLMYPIETVDDELNLLLENKEKEIYEEFVKGIIRLVEERKNIDDLRIRQNITKDTKT